MSTIQQLTSELSNLISESRRRNSDIKHASEKSLELLKNYKPQSPETETEFLLSLANQPEFITPFLLSCQTRNTKFSAISIQCLNKLIVQTALPIASLDQVLDAFIEATHLGIEIQLKIIQTLPQLFQNYRDSIQDVLIVKLIMICSILQTGNKSAVVINTSAATLQQLIVSVFDKVREEDQQSNVNKTHSVPIDNNQTILVGPKAYDAQRVFLDLCLLINHHKPLFLKFNYLSENSGFELIESIITNHKELFLNHVELGFITRTRVIPILLRFLSSSKNFSIIVRVSRIIYVLVGSLITILKIESEVVLSLLIHLLSNESATQPFKKILSLEIFNGLLMNFKLVQAVFKEYDSQPDRKNVLFEFLHSINEILTENAGILGISDIISTTTPQANSGISAQYSTAKVALLDSLDKAEAPANVSDSYILYLILNCTNSLADGIGKYVLTLSLNSENKSVTLRNQPEETKTSMMQSDIDFISNLVEKNWTLVIDSYKVLIYSSLDNELFHNLIRALQKLCQATGLLGLEKPRDEVLNLFAVATINNTSKLESSSQRILSIGGSIVESISSTINQHNQFISPPTPTSIVYHSRTLNTKNITCLRALISLAVSLGSNLNDSWKIVMITLQWVDYYINGSEEILKNLPKAPSLPAQDLVAIDNSYKRLIESIKEYSNSSFHELAKCIVTLSEATLGPKNISEAELGKAPLVEGELHVCAYNKIFYVNKLMEISKINARKFLIENNKNWNFIIDYFVTLGATRNPNINDLRVKIVKDFNSVIKYITIEGFTMDTSSVIKKESKEKLDKISSETSKKSLNALMEFTDSLLSLGTPSEVMLLNSETEIHFEVLKTLQHLIDKYGSFFKKLWDIVFKILNSPFKLKLKIESTDNNLREKVTLLIKSSFETFKLILDEFVFTLPLSQMKILIDSLYNFSSQKFDLNISFSSISYFWLISDSLRNSVGNTNDNKSRELLEQRIKSDEDLNSVTSNLSDDPLLFCSLWIYLLFTAAQISADDRDQVRNGSIQTFFRIIDSHGNYLPSWKLIYDIVLPKLLNLRPPSKENIDKKEWCESLNLILTGLVSLYTKFLRNFDSDPCIEDFWKGLVGYFSKMLSLGWIELNLKIFNSFNELLMPFSKDILIASETIKRDLFEFWSGVPIIYNFIDNKLYQDSLTSLMNCFPSLFHIMKYSITLEQSERILSSFNSCVRYPILPETYLDDRRCTKLQQSIIDNISIFEVDSIQINSLIIQQLGTILVLPFSTRSRIEKKLADKLLNRYKIPTFVAVSHSSLTLLQKRVIHVSDFKFLIEDGCLSKVLKSFLEVISLKSIGISKPDSKELWMEAYDFLLYFVREVSIILKEDDIDNQITGDKKTDVWKLILNSINLCIKGGEISAEHESFNIEKYHGLQKYILPNLELKSLDPSTLEELVENVYEGSFLYSKDEIDDYLINSSDSKEELLGKITEFDFNNTFGTTNPLGLLTTQKTRLVCLDELISFSTPKPSFVNSSRLSDISTPYFLCRVAFTLRKLISDEKLTNKAPLPKVQEIEVSRLLKGFLEIQKQNTNSDISKQLSALFPLIIKAYSYSHRIKGLQPILEELLQRMASNK